MKGELRYMQEKLQKEIDFDKRANYIDSKAKKFLTILGTSLLLLIPIGFLSVIISDRTNYRDEAVQNVIQSWAGAQTIGVPTMSFNVQNEKKETVVKKLGLGNYNTDVVIKTEIRKKGIFKVPVYTAEVSQKGDFTNQYGDLSNQSITTAINITDARGFVTEPTFKINNAEPQKIQDSKYATLLKTSAKTIPFEITYKIKGLNEINVVLGGLSNNVSIKGNWKDPSFEGDFLPTEREVTNKDFNAVWSVPKIALSQNSNAPSNIRVSLLVPVDSYSMADRALKYGYLLLTLTFLGYFIFEITSKENKRVHPIQYCLLGAAILIFYLLLVSISELLTFNLAYLLSAIMVIGLILVYTYFVITKKKGLGFSIGITTLLALLYTFFYVLLMLQDIALFVGSIGLFIIIATMMYLTRNVNWYSEDAE